MVLIFSLFLVYSEKDWSISDRIRVPRNFWENQENVFQFMEKIKEEFRIESEEDWYRISLAQIKAREGKGLLKKYSHSLLRLLQVAYPNQTWNLEKTIRRDKRSVQRWLFLKVEELFVGYEIIEDFFHDDLGRISGKVAQFDLFIPRLHAAFEFHGIHHSKEIPAFGSVDMYQERDREKEELCIKHKILLVTIPHHWDLTETHLIEFIKNSQPQLLQYVKK